MRRSAKLGIFLVVAGVAAAACRKASTAESIEPAASSSAERAPEAPQTPTKPSLDVGPAPAADRAARQQAVFALLAGELASDELPEVATEGGEALDHGLRDRLAPVRSGLGSLTRGMATVGPPQTSAPVSDASRVVAGMRAGFRACYSRILLDTPKAAGVVDMVIQVDAQGAVTDAKAKSSARLPAAMLSCLQSRAKAAQFAPPEGKTATIKFKVTFGLQ